MGVKIFSLPIVQKERSLFTVISFLGQWAVGSGQWAGAV